MEILSGIGKGILSLGVGGALAQVTQGGGGGGDPIWSLLEKGGTTAVLAVAVYILYRDLLASQKRQERLFRIFIVILRKKHGMDIPDVDEVIDELETGVKKDDAV